VHTRYLKAVGRFLLWAAACEVPYAASLPELDQQLAWYLEALWQQGDAKSLAGDTLSGAQHLLLQKRCFHTAWGLYGTWSLLEMPARVPPLTSHLVLALSGLAMKIQRPDYAMMLLLMFHCLLRPSEAWALTPEMVSINAAHRGVLALPLTKSGLRKGAQEMVTIDDPMVGKLTAALLARRSPGERLMLGSPHQFRAYLKGGLAAMGLQGLRYTAYSLRRGGATHDFMAHQDVARTVMRGRWGDLKTARIYITDGLAVQTQLQLTTAQRETANAYRTVFLQQMRGWLAV